MSVIYALQDYVNKCLNGIDGMKVLLLDAETVRTPKTINPLVLQFTH